MTGPLDDAQVAEMIRDTLMRHKQGFSEHRRPAFFCTGCEWGAVVVGDGRDGNGVTIADQHRVHVAAVLTERIEADRAALITRLAEVEWLFGKDFGDAIKAWEGR